MDPRIKINSKFLLHVARPSGRGDGQGDVEKKDHQLYRRPYMMGKARGKEEDLLLCGCLKHVRCVDLLLRVSIDTAV